MEKDILSFREFVTYADISQSRGYKAIHRKELPYYKPNGGRVYLKMKDIKNWMLQGRVPSASEVASKAKK